MGEKRKKKKVQVPCASVTSVTPSTSALEDSSWELHQSEKQITWKTFWPQKEELSIPKILD